MKKRKFIFIILILFISVGFAVLSSNLSISNLFTINEASFDVHLYNPNIIDTNTEGGTYLLNNSKDTITFTANLDAPGDYITYSFYIVNEGTIDAVIESFSISGIDSYSDYLTYSLKYHSGDSLSINDIIRVSTSKRLDFNIKYNDNIDNFINISNLTVTISFKFKQPQSINKKVWDFDYSEDMQVFTAPKSGNYKIETWGAQGGSSVWSGYTARGGYGGYSTGVVELTKDSSLDILVGGAGSTGFQVYVPPGYNGGGYAGISSLGVNSSGGGATAVYYSSDVVSCLGKDQFISPYIENYEFENDSVIIHDSPNGYFYRCGNYAKSSGEYYKVEWYGSGLSNSKLVYDFVTYPVGSSNYYVGGVTEIKRNVTDNLVELWYYITDDSDITEFRFHTKNQRVKIDKENVIKLSNPLIVAGGGGGSHQHPNAKSTGGDAGGYIGSNPVNIYQGSTYCSPPTGGTQSSGGSVGGGLGSSYYSEFITFSDFAIGGSFIKNGGSSYGAGGGAGYYGGGPGVPGNSCAYSGAGGSSYIGNASLTEKVMYCYNCEESSSASTKTISTTNVSATPTSNYAKIGNGHVRITYVS